MTATNELTDFLTTADAARLFGLQPITLHLWRRRGRGPEYLRLEGKVRYRRDDLESYLRECKVTPRRVKGAEMK